MNVQRLPLTTSMMDENEFGSVYSMGRLSLSLPLFWKGFLYNRKCD